MDKPKKQVMPIGNGSGKTPILASGVEATAELSQPSRPDTGKGLKNTKPVSLREALSLWQTACFDLQSYGFKTAILAENNDVLLLISPPASIGLLTVKNGHILIDGLPVSEEVE